MTDTSVALSSRVRLARNLAGFCFSPIIRDTPLEDKITSLAYGVLSRRGDFSLLKMSDASALKKQSLVERYLISPKLAESPRGAVALSKDETLSVMINEEDHLREQCFCEGLRLEAAYSRLSMLDRALANNLKFSKGKLGYLTACPSNVGTGMRASVMLFLPALTYSARINDFCEAALKRGLTVRGAFGEGSGAESYMYQLSNEVTFGLRETDIIRLVTGFALKVEEAEKEERAALYEDNAVSIEDACLRAYGTLTYCKKLGYGEFAELGARLKLGVSLGILKAEKPSFIDDLLVSARSAALSFIGGVYGASEEEKRADFVAKALKKIGVSVKQN